MIDFTGISDRDGVEYADDEKNERETFFDACQKAISDSKSALSKDLGWGDYLGNLFKDLANTVIWMFTLGNTSSFFNLKKSNSIDVVEDVEQALTCPKISVRVNS